jgi:signal transduction histidine kinase
MGLDDGTDASEDNRALMNPFQERPVRRGIRHVLLTALGVVLTLLLALGVYAARSLSSVSRAGTVTTREYFQQGERLESVRRLLSSAASAIRDYLLDPDSLALPVHREQARRSWLEAMKAIEDYKGVATPERRPLTDRLDAQVSGYWAIADRSLEMTGHQRTEAGVNLLIDQLVPLRDTFLETIDAIGARDRADLRSAAASSARFVQGAERRLWTAIALTVFLSLLVAGATVLYLVRLENTALAQYEASVKAAVELERLSRRLLTLQEDERRRIARELHDDYGQRMASLLFELAATAERTDATADLRLVIHKMAERLGNVAKDIQELSRSLHSAVLDKIGLEAAIRADCNSLRQRIGWDLDFQSADVPKRLPEPLSLAAYRVFQEVLQNALKHSQTSRLTVVLTVARGDLVLRVKDYGQGFDAESANQAGSLGLVSMRERMRMVGGAFLIHSEIGKGTQIEARAPMGGKERDAYGESGQDL